MAKEKKEVTQSAPVAETDNKVAETVSQIVTPTVVTAAVAENTPRKTRSYRWLWGLFGVVILAVIGGFLQFQIIELQKQVERLQYVYVYNLEEILRGIKLDDINREFEAKVQVLNEEVSTAQEQISAIKDSKDKDNFSKVYLKSLKLRRDTMIKDYGNALKQITDEINAKMTEVAIEKGITVIFDKQFIATKTPKIIDVTDEIVRKIKIERPKFLDE